MSAALTIIPDPDDGGVVEAKKTVCRIEVSGETSNEVVGAVMSGAERRLYITTELAGQDTGRSTDFAVNSDGEWAWDNYIFPAAGDWDVVLRQVEDDDDVATLSVTVS